MPDQELIDLIARLRERGAFLTDGKRYLNRRGDLIGPMNERVPGVFLDQYGRLYHPDGRQWDHVLGSTGNILQEAP